MQEPSSNRPTTKARIASVTCRDRCTDPAAARPPLVNPAPHPEPEKAYSQEESSLAGPDYVGIRADGESVDWGLAPSDCVFNPVRCNIGWIVHRIEKPAGGRGIITCKCLRG